MKRHPFDMTSFLFGVVLGGAGVGFVLADQLSWDVDGRWVLPAVLIVLGVAGIAGAVSGLKPRDRDADGARDADATTEVPDDDTAKDGEPQSATDTREIKSW